MSWHIKLLAPDVNVNANQYFITR